MNKILIFLFILWFLKLSLAQEKWKKAKIDSVKSDLSRDPCELIEPYCRCAGFRSIKSVERIICEEFDSFDQLDFSPFGYPDDKTIIINDLVLNPRVPLILNDSLKISNIVVRYNIQLKYIDGIELLSNPFRYATFGFRGTFIISNSNLRTFQTSCDTSLLTHEYVSLFSLFDYILIELKDVNEGELCPLVFRNANISTISISNMNRDNYLKFRQLTSNDVDFNLNSTVDSLYVLYSPQPVIDEHMIDKHVFGRLEHFYLNADNLNVQINERAFYHTQNLKLINFNLVDLASFIKSSNNTWMSDLNRDVRVNYTDPDSVEQNLDNALLIEFSLLFWYDNYTFPDEDLVYFRNFPHERFVFANILANEELECTETLKFLLQNAAYYEPIMSLNTTAITNCFTSTQSPSSGSTSKPTVYQSSTQPTNQFSSPITEPTTKPENQTTTESVTQQTSRVSMLSTVTRTNGYNSTEQESKEVLLSVYLWTVIPIGVVCLLAIIGFVVFLFLYLSQRTKIRPENSVNNNDNIALNTMQTSSQVD